MLASVAPPAMALLTTPRCASLLHFFSAKTCTSAKFVVRPPARPPTRPFARPFVRSFVHFVALVNTGNTQRRHATNPRRR